MSGVTVSISYQDELLHRHLQALIAADGSHWDDARRDIGDYLIGEIQDNFDDQRLASGAPMPPSAAADKRDGKTLIEHHHLYDSYVYQLTAEGVEVGSGSPYAAIHHFGGLTGRGHRTRIIPRPVLGIGPEQEQQIGDILINAIRRLP